MSINDLPLGYRAANVLCNAGISTVEDLCKQSVYTLSRRRNCGRATVAEIIEVLADHGLRLSPNGNIEFSWMMPSWVRKYDQPSRRYAEYIDQ